MLVAEWRAKLAGYVGGQGSFEVQGASVMGEIQSIDIDDDKLIT